MKWPAQSPDLNLIDNFWKIIGNKVMANITVTELWKKLEEEWKKIEPEQCEKLVESSMYRCAEVIQTKARYTFYKFFKAVTIKKFNCKLLCCYSGYSSLILT